jgi:hypothetical protein
MPREIGAAPVDGATHLIILARTRLGASACRMIDVASIFDKVAGETSRISSLRVATNGISSVAMGAYTVWILFLPIALAWWGYVVWTWRSWLKSNENVTPKWRAIITVGGLCFATISTLLSAFLYIHAGITGGYEYGNAVEGYCFAFGFLTAVLGIISGAAGKGHTRADVAAISALSFLLWFLEGMAQ